MGFSRDTLLAAKEFEQDRDQIRRAVIDTKKKRRLSVGPFVTVIFESHLTIFWQIHEILRAEKSWDTEVDEELNVYNKLLPDSHSFVATVMIEIEDPPSRKEWLAKLIDFDKHVAILLGDFRINAESIVHADDPQAHIKTSTVHFFRFTFSDEQMRAIAKPNQKIKLSIDHPNYDFETDLCQETLDILLSDCKQKDERPCWS